MTYRRYRKPYRPTQETPLPKYTLVEGPAPVLGGLYATLHRANWNEREQCHLTNLVESATGGIYLMTATFMGWQFGSGRI